MSEMMSERQMAPSTAREVLETLRERALLRLLGATSFDWRDYLTDEEATQYNAALELEGGQPEPEHVPAVTGETLTSVGRVLIEVYGGVAAVTEKPEGVDVEIIDHDNEEAEGTQSALDRFFENADLPQVSDNDRKE